MLFGVGVINRTAKVGPYWCSLGFAYERANGGCSLDAYLRPDACCSSPAFQAKKELVGDECEWPSEGGSILKRGRRGRRGRRVAFLTCHVEITCSKQ